MHKNLFALGVSMLVLAGCGSAPSQSQTEADQGRCAGYGYQPGTDSFAKCMMTVDVAREKRDARDHPSDARMKSLSIERNGDTRFPICSAAGMDNNLDTVNNAWYGPNCRQR
ncbi:hypothetical protein [Comamonas piscis]